MSGRQVVVADSGAMIAYLRGEPGGDVFRNTLRDPGVQCYAHAANMAEVLYDCIRRDGEARALELLDDLKAIGVSICEDMDTAFWQDLARIKAGPNPSFADCFCLALGRRLGATVLSTDHHEFDNDDVRALCAVQFIR